MTRIMANELTELAVRVLCASNTTCANAQIVAEALVAADMDGLASHGVSRLPDYADQANSGKVDGRAVPDVRQDGGSIVRVDARTGFAFPALRAGLKAGVECAQRTGIAAVAVTNSHHFGVAGHHAERVAAAGLVALGFGNSPAAIAPWGGVRGVFGTNPIAFAVPRREQPPLVVDLSLSKVARGKVLVARQRGEGIPDGWAFDAQGKKTTAPEAVLSGGTMAPMGGAKGAALALIVEILSGALTGANFGFEMSSFFEAEGPAPRVGQLFLILDPERFSDGNFPERLEVLFTAMTSQQGVRLPGARRLALRKKNRRNGVDIPGSLLRELRKRDSSGNYYGGEGSIFGPETVHPPGPS